MISLRIVGAPFGFMAFLGIISLIGVSVSHVIVLFDCIEEKHEAGEALEEALVQARQTSGAAPLGGALAEGDAAQDRVRCARAVLRLGSGRAREVTDAVLAQRNAVAGLSSSAKRLEAAETSYHARYQLFLADKATTVELTEPKRSCSMHASTTRAPKSRFGRRARGSPTSRARNVERGQLSGPRGHLSASRPRKRRKLDTCVRRQRLSRPFRRAKRLGTVSAFGGPS